MIELIAFETGPRTPLTPNAWTSLCAGLIEAVGRLRDPLSRPVLMPLWIASQPTTRCCARPRKHSAGWGPTRMLRTWPLCPCLRIAPSGPARGTGRLSSRGRGSAWKICWGRIPSDEAARAIVESLGRVGSSWAWQTAWVAEHAAEEDSVRSTAARALVHAVRPLSGSGAPGCPGRAFGVDHPSTPSWIASGRQGATPELLQQLDQLQQRFAHNPAR